jgi:hypothetical protein
MWWKVIAFLYAAGYLWAVFDPAYAHTALRMITTAFVFPAVVGLFLFAFDKRFLPRLFWKVYAVISVAYWAIPFVLFGARILTNEGSILIEVILVAIYSLFVLPVVRSLWWLSFARTESAPPRLSEASAP